MDRFIHTRKLNLIKIPKAPHITSTIKPYKSIAIAPLVDDYYSRLLDWSGESIVYASDNIIYHYNTSLEVTNELVYYNLCLNSIKIHETEIISGISTGSLHIQNFESNTVTKYQTHKARIGAIEIKNNIVYTGSRDRTVKCMDKRTGKEESIIKAHLQEVCGLKINNTGVYIASGGNDNKLFVHDLRKLEVPLFKAQKHKAAVKALFWSPNKSTLLVSGGGTADKSVKIWDMQKIGKENNIGEDALLKSLDHQSQVCNLYWTKTNEIISTHGYSRNDIRVVGAGSLELRSVYSGSVNRTIHFAVNTKETEFVCGGSDGMLNFWKIKDKSKDNRNTKNFR
ncbi:hypothetical protein BDAP_002751 [Binucleata daphniae]